jgi:hypothetical protein
MTTAIVHLEKENRELMMEAATLTTQLRAQQEELDDAEDRAREAEAAAERVRQESLYLDQEYRELLAVITAPVEKTVRYGTMAVDPARVEAALAGLPFDLGTLLTSPFPDFPTRVLYNYLPNSGLLFSMTRCFACLYLLARSLAYLRVPYSLLFLPCSSQHSPAGSPDSYSPHK